MKRCAILVSSLAMLAGCYRTTIRSGLPPGTAADGYENRWHSGWVLGAAEGSGPHELNRLCPDGWAEVHTRGNFVTALATLASSGIYAPHQITIVCAAVPGPPPVEGYAPLPRPAADGPNPPPNYPPGPPPIESP